MDIKKKLKIGILTFHDGINHGAYLQCYGLYKTIENMGHDVKIINYKNFKHWWKEYKCFLWTKNPRILYANIRKIFKFKVEQRKLPKTTLTFSHKKVKKENFDVIIIGSDRVWDYKNSFFGLDPIYFGSFLNSKKLFAYACSFGCVKPNDHIPREVICALKKFSKVSVRDDNSLKILKKITRKPVKLVLDPTLLYNYTREEKVCPYKDFILIYSYQINSEQIKGIRNFAEEKNLDIIAIAYNQPWCDKNIINISPFEWLGYFIRANYIITSTFHGTIFSIKYNKQFVTLPNIYIDNKLETILNITGLKNRVLYKANNLEQLLGTKIYYNPINNKLSKSILDSINFLRKNISK